MNDKTAKAEVKPRRQRSQYTCMSASLAMALQAGGLDVTEDEVNDVLGARPMKGASWEQILAACQHFGFRATLTMPATVKQLKEWTDRGVAVMIAWNPEGRDWSHASTVFDVDDDGNVWVADPNIPDPDETVRVIPKGDFYSKWFEKWPNYLVRRPACAIEREVTSEGRQMMAGRQKRAGRGWGDYIERKNRDWDAKHIRPKTVKEKSKRVKIQDFDVLLKAEENSKGWVTVWIEYEGRGPEKDFLDTLHKAKKKKMPRGRGLSFFVSADRGIFLQFYPEKSQGIDRDLQTTESFLNKLFEPEKQPPARVDKTWTPEHVEVLQTLVDRNPGNGFLKGMLALVQNGRPLTEKQLSAIRHNLYKNRMRNEANLFRVASLHRKGSNQDRALVEHVDFEYEASAQRVALRYLKKNR